jgi:hypothetical protein
MEGGGIGCKAGLIEVGRSTFEVDLCGVIVVGSVLESVRKCPELAFRVSSTCVRRRTSETCKKHSL